MDIPHRVKLLQGTRFFHTAPVPLLSDLVLGCEEVRIEPGEVLFVAGDPGDALYVIDSGVLEVYLGTTHLDESTVGECIGEMALLTEEARTASIRAKEASVLLKLPRASFRQAIDQRPELAWGVIRELAAKVKSSIRARVEQHQFTVRLEEALARSVSQTVLETLLRSHHPIEHTLAVSKQVTVLYAHIRSFGSLSERLEPEVLIGLLNEYLTGMVEVIMDHGGTLDRFRGDGILAQFGAPLSCKQDARQAVTCAFQMLERLTELNRTGRMLPRHPIQIGVGLATGTAVAGIIGTEQRKEYTAMGDVVHLASAVESLTGVYGAEVLLCDETARKIGSDLLMREVDRVKLRGRGRPTHIYDVVAPAEALTPEIIKFVGDYRSAFALYAAGRFEEAGNRFAELSRLHPDDGPIKTLADRCHRFCELPPAGWECVFDPELD